MTSKPPSPIKPVRILQVSTLLASGASLVASVWLYFAGSGPDAKLDGIYVGVWVPSILALGAFLVSSSKRP